MPDLRYISGQGVVIDAPDLGVVGRCSVIDNDEEAETISVVTKYEDRDGRRFVQDIPWASVTAADPKRRYQADGVDQRAHGAIERMAGRFVEHSKRVGKPMDASEAFSRATTVAKRVHGHGPPGRKALAKERSR